MFPIPPWAIGTNSTVKTSLCARAMNWERCEASSQLAWEKDLVRLAFLIHHCQDELDRRPLTNLSNSELLRLLFSARRDYFKRRDPLLAPLERLTLKAQPSTKLDSPNKPDKTGRKPDASHNHRNGNGFHKRPTAACGVPASAGTVTAEADDSQIVSAQPEAVPSPGAAGECLGERQVQLGQGEGGIAVLSIAPTERNRTQPNDFSPGESHNSHNSHDSQTPAPTLAEVEVPACDRPKKHKPYWLNGHYYANPELPYHVARATHGK
jgi:hypothetical protein